MELKIRGMLWYDYISQSEVMIALFNFQHVEFNTFHRQFQIIYIYEDNIFVGREVSLVERMILYIQAYRTVTVQLFNIGSG